MKDADRLTRSLQLEVPKAFPHRARFWRRSVGGAVPIATVRAGIALIRSGHIEMGISMLNRPLTFGVSGEPDLDGWITIGGVAVRAGIEIKAGRDRIRPEQENYRDILTDMGGIYVEARDVEQAVDDLRARVAEISERGMDR